MIVILINSFRRKWRGKKYKWRISSGIGAMIPIP
jgi:hypothetical protein